MLSAEAIKEIATLARTAAALEIKTIPGDPRCVIVAQNGTHEKLPLPAPLRSHAVCSLLDLCTLVEEFATETSGSVWHDESAVRFVLDDADRREGAVFELSLSRPYLLLRELQESQRWMDQKQFCRMLRGKLGLPVEQVAPFRMLEWSNSGSNRGAVGLGRESLGREIQAQVRGEQDIPEEMSIAVPIYREPGETQKYPIRVIIDTEPGQCQISMQPYPGELEGALAAAQGSIHERLLSVLAKKGEMPVYYGRPVA